MQNRTPGRLLSGHIATQAFTLTEVLVVVVIVALLAVMVIPTIMDFRSRTNEVICRNNLNRIGQISELQLRDFSPSRQKAFHSPEQWVLLALDDADHKREVMTCPEGGKLFYLEDGDQDEVQAAAGGGYTVTGDVEISPNNNDGSSFEMDTPSGTIDREMLHEEGSAYTYTGATTEIRIKLKGNSKLTLNGQQITLPKNVAHTLSSSSMTANLYNTKGGKGKAMGQWHIDIDGTNVMIDPDPGLGPVVAAEEPIDDEREHFYVSFGINPNITDAFGIDPNKVLAMDYDELVVAGDDGWWSSGNYTFARHFGRVNVLFRDGTVRSLAPEGLDPATAPDRY